MSRRQSTGGALSGAHGVGGVFAVSGRDARAFTAPRVSVRETRRVGSVRVSNAPRLVARASRVARACVRARARSQLRPTRAASEGKSIPRQCANFRSGFARHCVTKNSFAANPMPSDPRRTRLRGAGISNRKDSVREPRTTARSPRSNSRLQSRFKCESETIRGR